MVVIIITTIETIYISFSRIIEKKETGDSKIVRFHCAVTYAVIFNCKFTFSLSALTIFTRWPL